MKTLRYDDISVIMRHYIGAHESFRRLGFLPEQISMEVNKAPQLGGKDGVFAVLRAQNKQFSVIIGEAKSIPKLNKEYREVVESVVGGSFPQADLDRIWQESECRKNWQDFVSSILLKGFSIPKRVS